MGPPALLLGFISLTIITLGQARQNGTGTFRIIRISPKSVWQETAVDRLRKDLFMNYDKFMRPPQQVTQVNIGLSLIHLETDESKSAVIVHSNLRMMWNDNRLQWNDSYYNGLGVIRVADREIWHPDLLLYNSCSPGEPVLRKYGRIHVIVYDSGEVLYVPHVRIKALCQFKLSRWPFDVQKCYLRFTPWSFRWNEIQLNLYNDESFVDQSDWNINLGEWDINSTASIMIDQRHFQPHNVYFNLTLTRRPGVYKLTVAASTIVLPLLISFQFLIPARYQEKYVVNGCLFLISCILLLFFGAKTGAPGGETPIVVWLYCLCVCCTCISTLEAVVLSSAIVGVEDFQPLPRRVRMMMGGRFGQLVLIGASIQGGEGSRGSLCKQDWELLVTFVQRVSCLVFVTLFVGAGCVTYLMM